MNKTILSLLLLISVSTIAQDDLSALTKPIVDEGKQLYKSEMASWYGTDLFLEKHKDQSTIGGYFSYIDNGVAKCIFFSKADQPKVIGTISFDSTYNLKKAMLDMAERDFTNTENDLYVIRKNALAAVNSDTLFKTYKNSNLNLIPLINNNEKKVYILTGPEQSGVVILGND
jgi:hypothetical protein